MDTKVTNIETVTSRDGTTIAYDRLGSGPPLVLISGGSVDRQSNAPLARALAVHFTVFNYDRRGRGPSGDTPPYAIEREVEDIDAVVEAAGGSAYLYGSSSGAALGLIAAELRPGRITKLVMWEPPFILDPAARPPADQLEQYNRMLSEGRRGDAAQYFMEKVVGMPAEFVASARSQPWWPGQEAIAHTLPYDATIMGDYSVPEDRAKAVSIPALVIDGGASFGIFAPSADVLASLLPHGERHTIPGQGHDVDPSALAPVIAAFLKR